MRHAARTFYRFRTFDVRTLDALCYDTLHFALPSGFNDPLDSRPSLRCDSSTEELRLLLGHLVRTRVTSEVNESLARLRLKGPKAAQYATKTADEQSRRALADIAYHSTNPEYEEGSEQAERGCLPKRQRGSCYGTTSGGFAASLLTTRALCCGVITAISTGVCALVTRLRDAPDRVCIA